MHNVQTDHEATVFGLVSAAVLSNVPDWVLPLGDKLLYGALLALITGFTYKAGGYVWDRFIRSFRK